MLRDIEKNIEDYHDFLLADIKQRSSFIDIVRNLYSSFSAMPREFAQVIADSSVGQFADDPQMLREHKKYSEHVRLAVLDRAPRTPGWLNESAEVFLDKLSRDPESLLPHQLAEYFIYLSKESKKEIRKVITMHFLCSWL